MTLDAALFHQTRYDYDRLVTIHPQVVRLRPAPHSRTKIRSYSLKIEPALHFLNWQQDPFGNFMARLVFPEKAKHLQVTVDLVADMTPFNPFDFFLEEEVFETPFGYDEATRKELEPYLATVEMGSKSRELLAWAQAFFEGQDRAEDDPLRTIDFLVGFNQRLMKEVAYTVRMEPGVQTPEETLTKASGSCRDSAWLAVALLRELGLAARFCSGYLIQLKADVQGPEGLSGPAEDFTDLHAWAEVYLPGAGWVGIDPTSGLFAGEGHIPLAATPAPSSAAPISGAVQKSEATLSFDMKVTRLAETPRTTKPLSEALWQKALEAGDAIDAMMQADDVRLTVGGEPTFVAAQDRDADEWNIEATGPTKERYADDLIRRLHQRFAPGGFIHHGQGKWYPGETLPRWAYAVYWRKDGHPIWQDPSLIAGTPQALAREASVSAEAFAEGLAQALGFEPDAVLAAYEDPAEFVLRERKLPENVDSIDNKLEDPEARARLARVFERGLDEPVAFALPIQAAQARALSSPQSQSALARAAGRRRYRWRTERWQTRRERLFLIPGDSAAGYRLPLMSLPYLAEGERPEIISPDPLAPREPLFRPPTRMQSQVGASSSAGGSIEPGGASFEPLGDTDPTWPPPASSTAFTAAASGPIRIAMSVEERDGILHVFMPPVASIEEYLDLVAAVEDTASILKRPVRIEGYAPPHDYRLDVVKVTPDPGVIEVNVQPASDWRQLVEITETLYEEAAACGLEASKFLLDGRPTGSGGGAHLVVGGKTPSDSPFLRRPDLLGSLIRFWQNHPSLSYLFSGMFIGPTSQSPRVDEARLDSLYELDIALSQVSLPDEGVSTPPWMVDRLFRNLLTDVTGNTHRAEICIDKLFSPDSSTGRLGLLEFRAFEMPPHAQMNLTQQLLVKALIAWFWRHPYTRPLKRFGNALHDRYMLPSFLWSDLEDVLSEVSAATGVMLDPAWYKAQFEFRFPHYGQVRHGGLTMDLRAGLEPWPVLGEEGAIGGTVRFVDSSVERLEVLVEGTFTEEIAVTCNGYRLPLVETERTDVRVAGVRFRAWQPASCLHPTIGPHTPLVFDIVDLAAGRSLGGCVYHSAHPGGRNFDLQPVNALEASGRRRARFETIGHSAGPLSVREPRPSSEFPMTLDLMRQ